jgi:hypothetical protein
MRSKRFVALVVIVGALVGGVGVAWAHVGGGPLRREALRTCRQEARDQNPDADREALKAAVKSCLEAQGLAPGQRLSDEQKAQAKACVQAAREANPDADRPTVLAAARPCLEAAGLARPLTPEQQERRAKALACFQQAKADHPGDRHAIRHAVRECMAG